jgi:hypothetical protein
MVQMGILAFWLFYIPVYIFIFIRGFIRRSLTFFLFSQPGITIWWIRRIPQRSFVEASTPEERTRNPNITRELKN